METPRPIKNLFVFVDGQNFISHINTLFPEEFDRSDYLPRKANWQALFHSLAKTLRAKTVDVYWYTIKSLEYSPDIFWKDENLGELSDDEYKRWREHIIRPHIFEARWGDLLKLGLR